MMIFLYSVTYTLVDATVKATLLLALAAALAVFSRRASASFRHFVWALGLGCVLCLPVLSSHLPHWRVPITAPPTHLRPTVDEAPSALADTPQTTPKTTIATDSRPQTSNHSPAMPTPQSSPALPPAVTPKHVRATNPAAPSPTPAPEIPWRAWVLLAWAVGAFVVLVRLAQSLVAVRRIAQASVPVTTGPIADAMGSAAKAMGVGRPVTLRQASGSGQVTVPFTYGAFRPVLVLPFAAQSWPEERMRAVLLHEMAHVRRHDWILQVLAYGACALYWFHPLVWMAARKMRTESETACDDLVLSAGLPARDYARHLLDVALCARQSRRISDGAVAMAQTPRVEGRLRAVLAQGLSRRPVTTRTATGLVGIALLLALPLASLQLAAHGEPVPAADQLQLQGDFTLTYAVTIRNQQTTAMLLRLYQQMRQDYMRELRTDPYFQPVPEEFYMPFGTFQKRRMQPRQMVITISSRSGSLFYQTVEGDEAFAQIYDGHTTQRFGNGHAGSSYMGLHMGELTAGPLPAVGFPNVPFLKKAMLVNSSGPSQTWNADILYVGEEQDQNQPSYMNGLAHAVRDGGAWKLLDTDNAEQQWQFLQHQRFQGLWIASRMQFIQYDTNSTLPPKGKFTTIEGFRDWFKRVRKPSEISEYRLLSASTLPVTPSTFVRKALLQSASTPSFQKMQDYYLQEALHLRYHLQGWAIAHKALLQKMAKASPNDRSPAQRVDASLRSLPFPLYPGDTRPFHVWDGDPRTAQSGQKPVFTAERLSPSNPTSQDFEIARSRNSGTFHVILWASGRITRTTGQGTTRMARQEEIVPAFFDSDGTRAMAGDAPPAAAATPLSLSQLISSQTPDAAAATLHVALGRKAQERGQPRDGIPEFRRAVALDPYNADAQYQLAQALYEIMWKQFKTPTRNTTVSVPAPPAVLNEAIQHMRKYVALRPYETPSLSTLGTYLANRGRYAEAISYYKQALHLLVPSTPKPGFSPTHAETDNAQQIFDNQWLLGEVLVKTGQYREAVVHYQEALRSNPKAFWVLLGYGDALNRIGRHTEARAAWQKIIRLKGIDNYYGQQAQKRLAE